MAAQRTFKVCDIKRAVSAVKSAGLDVSAVVIGTAGEIKILTGATDAAQIANDPLAAWEQARGLSAN